MTHLPLVEIRKTVRGPLPRIPFQEIAKEILPGRYELSLVVCGDTLAQRMNTTYRQKTYRPNVLSFPNDTYEGELFLNIRCAAREAKRYNVKYLDRLALLFVHGCLHLRGMDHGERMEKEEVRILAKFGFGHG